VSKERCGGGAIDADDEAPRGISNATPARVRMPLLDALRVFETAARHASFTRAAEELHVTPGAVSHRIQALEADLKVALFRRLTRRLELTEAGVRLAAGVREGLDRIASAVQGLGADSHAGPLTVSMLPSFASRWLIPRLPRFHRRHPEIEVRVLAEDRPADLWSHDGPEVAIRFGRGRYPGLAVTPLMSDSVIPVCSPYLYSRHGWVDSVDALLAMPLLHDSAAEHDDSGSDWKSWLAHIGAPADDPRIGIGPRFSQAHLAIEAALLGQGVALARTSLLGADLASGRLVSPLPRFAPTAYRYFLVCRPEIVDRSKTARFCEWLIAEAAGTTAAGGTALSGVDHDPASAGGPARRAAAS
jgi:LysR family glycine cleavage system transcriptional activator